MATDYAGGMTQLPRINPGLVIAWIKLWVYRLFKSFIGIGYIAVIIEGLRMVVPALGTKLHRLPLLGALKDYEFWHDLDMAPFVAAVLFTFSNWIWCQLLEAWLYEDAPLYASDRSERVQQCLMLLGGIILFADACLFYRAMTLVAWGTQTWSLTSLMSTLAYLAVLVCLCMQSVNLKREYLSLKRGYTP